METIFVVVEQDGVFNVKGAFNVEIEEVEVTVVEEGNTWSSTKKTNYPIIDVPVFGFAKVKAVIVEDEETAELILEAMTVN